MNSTGLRETFRGGRLFWTGVVIVLSLAIRAPLLDATTTDTRFFVLPWFEQLAAGGYSALGAAIPEARGGTSASYTPPYYYLLWLASPLVAVVPKLWVVKLVSIAFDFLAAFFAFKLMRLRYSQGRALVAAAVVLTAPTVLANAAWWGQCDIIWTSLLLGSFYFSVLGWPLVSVILFGIGFATKAQAIFFAPFLLMLFLSREVRWWHLAVIPIVYAAMMLPAVIIGRSWLDVLTIYVRQGGHFNLLSLNAPNLYYFIPHSFYAAGTVVGSIFALLASASLAALPRLKKATPLGIEARLLAATTFVALSPYLLPKMHERYFFAADVFSIVLAFYVPRLWLVPVVFQASSLAAYVPIVALNVVGEGKPHFMPMAVMLNTAVITFLVYEFWRTCTKPGERIGISIRQFSIVVAAIVSATALWLSLAGAKALLSASLCRGRGESSVGICMLDLPASLTYGGRWHWLIFLALLGCSYWAAKVAILRLWGYDRR